MSDNPPARARIPIEDLIHYRRKGLSTTEIAKLTGCDHSNVARRLKNVDLEGLDKFKENKDAALEHLQRRTLNSITYGDIQKLNALQRITGAAILEDKIRAIRGQAVEIVEHRQLQVDLNRAIEQLRATQQEEREDVVDVPVIP